LKPKRISVYTLAKRLRVPAPRINDIVLEKRGITADTAVRLTRSFGTTEQFWLNLKSGEARILNSGYEGFKLTSAPFVATAAYCCRARRWRSQKRIAGLIHSMRTFGRF